MTIREIKEQIEFNCVNYIVEEIDELGVCVQCGEEFDTLEDAESNVRTQKAECKRMGYEGVFIIRKQVTKSVFIRRY